MNDSDSLVLEMDLTQYLKTRARSPCSRAGADVMAMQSRGGAHRSECFQIRCIKSAVRLERRGETGYEGLRAIDTAPRVSAAVRGPRDATFYVLGFCGRNSNDRLVAAIFNIRVDPARDSARTEQRLVRSSTLSSCDRGGAVEGGRGLGSRS